MANHLKLVKKEFDELAGTGVSEGTHELINPNDFKTITLKISLLNSTTKTEIRDGKRIYGIDAVKIKKDEVQSDLSIQMSELLEKGIVIEVPSHVCASGHMVVLTIITQNATPEVSFTTSAKVESTEKLPNGREKVVTTFTQFDEAGWENLKGVFARRQDEILNFFQAVKG